MCGIFALLKNNKKINMLELQYEFNKLVNRGPDYSVLKEFNNNLIIGFTRLSINDVSDNGHQPFEFEDRYHKYVAICNGELYNFMELKEKYKLVTNTTSDCGILIPLFLKVGFKRMIDLLNGVFALSIIKINKETLEIEMNIARDRIGVRPLFYSNINNFFISSEIKAISNITENINIFPPGNIATISSKDNKLKFTPYYNFNYNGCLDDNTEDNILSLIRIYFTKAIKKRLMSHRPLGSLLSGGLDSSLVSALTRKFSKKKIKTFSIAMSNGTDIKYAEMVADHINSDHTTIKLSKGDFLAAIEPTIEAIESYDITTVRASVGQYLVSKYISENSDIKVVMSGDGSDELCSGYIYNYNAPNGEELHKEAEIRLKEIHLYDVLRADRATSCHGLELRVPFLDQDFIDMYMKIPAELRKPKEGRMEKYLIRKAFANQNILPDEVLWRKKEAFSDGVSSEEESWFEIINKYIDTQVTDEEYEREKVKFSHCPPTSKEAYYYRKIFCKLYGNKNCKLIPKFWLPNWCGDIKEPSARVLEVYNQNDENETTMI
jgi:asparagine synthase (glutamine-hydrolysing)